MAIVRYTLDPKNPPRMTPEEKARFDAMTDEDIDYSDIPELTDEMLAQMRRADASVAKERLTVRIDADVVAWLRSMGKGYQTRMNRILRNAMSFDGRVKAVQPTPKKRRVKAA